MQILVDGRRKQWNSLQLLKRNCEETVGHKEFVHCCRYLIKKQIHVASTFDPCFDITQNIKYVLKDHLKIPRQLIH